MLLDPRVNIRSEYYGHVFHPVRDKLSRIDRNLNRDHRNAYGFCRLGDGVANLQQ